MTLQLLRCCCPAIATTAGTGTTTATTTTVAAFCYNRGNRHNSCCAQTFYVLSRQLRCSSSRALVFATAAALSLQVQGLSPSSSLQRHRKMVSSSSFSSSTSASNHVDDQEKKKIRPNNNKNNYRMATIEEAYPRLLRRFNEQANLHGGSFPLFLKLPKHFEKTVKELQHEEFLKNGNGSQQQQPRIAAVLVLLADVDGIPSIILTKRASRLNSHASELALPGGHYEADQDESLQATAIRETLEELLPQQQQYTVSSLSAENNNNANEWNLQDYITVIGPTTPLPSLKGTPVTPFVAVLHQFPHSRPFAAAAAAEADHNNLKFQLSHPVSRVFPGDPTEVAEVFHVPLQQLIESETTHTLPNRNRFGLVQAPLFPAPPYGDIWGLTAFILRPLLHKLFQPVFVVHSVSKVPSSTKSTTTTTTTTTTFNSDADTTKN